MTGKTARATRATKALDEAGVRYAVHAYAYEAGPGRIGLQAAEALGVPAAQLLKTLMVLVDGKAACAIVPADRELSLKKLASALCGRSARMMPLEDAERTSGYVVGGISPFGQRRRVPTAMEEATLTHERVFLNAGRRGLQLEMAPGDAARALDAVVASLCR